MKIGQWAEAVGNEAEVKEVVGSSWVVRQRSVANSKVVVKEKFSEAVVNEKEVIENK